MSSVSHGRCPVDYAFIRHNAYSHLLPALLRTLSAPCLCLWSTVLGGFCPHANALLGRPPPTVVAFYCFEYGNAWFPNWGPSSLGLEQGTGLGGSEEALIHLSRELADLGFWVEVYADPVERDVGRDRGFGRGGGRVVWYPYKAYDASCPPDVFVAWR